MSTWSVNGISSDESCFYGYSSLTSHDPKLRSICAFLLLIMYYYNILAKATTQDNLERCLTYGDDFQPINASFGSGIMGCGDWLKVLFEPFDISCGAQESFGFSYGRKIVTRHWGDQGSPTLCNGSTSLVPVIRSLVNNHFNSITD